MLCQGPIEISALQLNELSLVSGIRCQLARVRHDFINYNSKGAFRGEGITRISEGNMY